MEPKETALLIGASRGIGRTFALEAARRGVLPTVVARRFDPDDAELLEAAQIVHADVSHPAGRDLLRHQLDWRSKYVFWVAGAYARSAFSETKQDDVDRALAMHQAGMVRFMQAMHVHRQRMTDDRRSGHVPRGSCPIMYVVMGSISSYKLRKGEAVYAMAKAGQAAFLRNYAGELAEAFAGSRILLVNCARLGSEPGEQKLDAGGKRIDPGLVAKLVWGLIDGKDPIMNRPFTQLNIERTSDKPIVTYGPQLPEIP
jgi:NAD(P)-dependent dehydrogenase (short-subunit alcohol dehydrogenase family)